MAAAPRLITEALDLDWKVSTQNCYIAWLPYNVTIQVERNRSWKKLGQDKPWRITGFGNHWLDARSSAYADEEDAMRAAEILAAKVIRALAALLPETPSSMEVMCPFCSKTAPHVVRAEKH